MGWGTETEIFNSNVVASVEQSSAVTLNPGEVAHVTVDPNFPASPTDDLIVRIRATLDGTNYDDTPIWSQTLPCGTDPGQVSVILSGMYQFLVELERDGSSDTIAVVVNYRKDGVNL